MKPIYCNNCKYYSHLCFIPSPNRKQLPNHVCMYLSEMHLNPVSELIFDNLVDCLKFNDNLKCNFYKRKWYKFWIKGE